MNENTGRSKHGVIGAGLPGKSGFLFEFVSSIASSARFYNALVFFLVVVLALVWAMRILPDSMLADEGDLWSEIFMYLHGCQYSTVISPLPGYHLTMSYMIKVLHLGESLPAARCLNWFLTLFGLGFF